MVPSGPPRTVRGPRALLRAGERLDDPGHKAPPHRVWSAEEWRCYWWLTTRAKLIENLDFDFQSSFEGGRLEFGGLVIDFLLFNYFPPGLVINPLGYEWHARKSEDRVNDLENRKRLMDRGYTVVYLLDDDINRGISSLDYAMKNALAGRELPSVPPVY